MPSSHLCCLTMEKYGKWKCETIRKWILESTERSETKMQSHCWATGRENERASETKRDEKNNSVKMAIEQDKFTALIEIESREENLFSNGLRNGKLNVKTTSSATRKTRQNKEEISTTMRLCVVRPSAQQQQQRSWRADVDIETRSSPQ